MAEDKQEELEEETKRPTRLKILLDNREDFLLGERRRSLDTLPYFRSRSTEASLPKVLET